MVFIQLPVVRIRREAVIGFVWSNGAYEAREPIKVQWRVLIGIERCIQQRLRILTSLDSVFYVGDVRVVPVYLPDLSFWCYLWMSPGYVSSSLSVWWCSLFR